MNGAFVSSRASFAGTSAQRAGVAAMAAVRGSGVVAKADIREDGVLAAVHREVVVVVVGDDNGSR